MLRIDIKLTEVSRDANLHRKKRIVLSDWHEQHAHGLWHFCLVAVWRELTGRFVYFENHQVVAVAVGTDQPVTIGGEVEIARMPATGRDDLNALERAVSRIALEDRDAVVAAV